MNTKIGFIGGGNMAEAIISGIKKTAGEPSIRVNEPLDDRLQYLVNNYAVIPSDLPTLVENSSVMILAVKPKDIPLVLQQLKKHHLKEKLLITIAAGVPLKLYYRYLPGTAVVRVMPNTGATVLQAMSGMVRGDGVTSEQAETAAQIFSAIGRILWVPEEKINAVTALSGSGPAYFYLFTESLIQAGIHLGLTEQEATLLAQETMVGAGKMLTESGKSPRQLREEVTSPNGTTYAALTSFSENQLPETVAKAVEACARRAEEMEGEYLP